MPIRHRMVELRVRRIVMLSVVGPISPRMRYHSFAVPLRLARAAWVFTLGASMLGWSCARCHAPILPASSGVIQSVNVAAWVNSEGRSGEQHGPTRYNRHEIADTRQRTAACADMPETTRLAGTIEKWWPETKASSNAVSRTPGPRATTA